MKTRIATHYPGYGCAPSLHAEALCDECDTWSIILYEAGHCPKCGAKRPEEQDNG